MKISPDKVACFHYQLSEVGQDVLEKSDDTEPVAYLHGHGNILPALEKALEGKEAGDVISVNLSPEEAYGQRQDGKQQRVPIKHLLTKGKLRPGLAVKINTADGAIDARILKVGRFNVDVDTNHPLAGLSLTFAITIDSVRVATAEEIEHRHVHGKGGHHH